MARSDGDPAPFGRRERPPVAQRDSLVAPGRFSSASKPQPTATVAPKSRNLAETQLLGPIIAGEIKSGTAEDPRLRSDKDEFGSRKPE